MKIQGAAFCPFCYGNESKTPPEILAYGRTGGGPNTPGWNVRVVPNKYPALGIEGDLNREGEGMFDRMNGVGAHEIIIETPDHLATLATLRSAPLRTCSGLIVDRVLDLKNDKRLRYALIFEITAMPPAPRSSVALPADRSPIFPSACARNSMAPALLRGENTVFFATLFGRKSIRCWCDRRDESLRHARARSPLSVSKCDCSQAARCRVEITKPRLCSLAKILKDDLTHMDAF